MSTKQRARNTEHGTQSTEHRAPCSKLEAPNSKHQAPSIEVKRNTHTLCMWINREQQRTGRCVKAAIQYQHQQLDCVHTMCCYGPLHARKLKIQIILYFSLIREACLVVLLLQLCVCMYIYIYTVYTSHLMACNCLPFSFHCTGTRARDLRRNGEINYCDLLLIRICALYFCFYFVCLFHLRFTN